MAFQDSAKIHLSLPESLVKIGRHAFNHATKFLSIEFNRNVDEISYEAFNYCPYLQQVTFKGTPTLIDITAFRNCNKLTTINVPWSEGEVANAPWGAVNATINYNYTGE